MEPEPDLEPPNSTTITTASTTANHRHSLSLDNNDDDYDHFYVDESSNCSTPYVSAPSSPGRLFPAAIGFFYSAPASPMHYALAAAAAPVRSSAASAVALAPAVSDASSSGSFEFEFSARFDSPAPEIGPPPMSSADELFLNGQIRPMKLSAHLQRPQALAPLIDLGGEEERENEFEDDDEDVFQRGRDMRFGSRSQRRRTRSLSPLRSTAPFDWFYSDDMVSTAAAAEKKDDTAEERENNGGGQKEERENENETESEATPLGSASSSRCSSAGRSSKRWVFLKDFLRSKSEGRSNNKFWQNISFSPAKERKERESTAFLTAEKEKMRMRKKSPPSKAASTAASAAAKRRSAHEMHYTANRAQSEEMRRKTFLPYRQGLLGCLGFNSKSYGAINGFARALNPVSSR